MRIHGNQVVIRYANFNETQKFLVAFGNENLFVNGVAKGTFLGRSAYLKISVQPPSCDFCDAHRYRKINKDRRADSCEADDGDDSEFTGLLHFSDVSRL
jgi:hypothetical protein